MMMESIKYNLGNLTNFEGRDSRKTFWLYVLFLVVLQFVIGLIASLPLTFGAFEAAFDGARSGATEVELQAAMFQRMSEMITTQVWISAGLGLISALLIVAAFTRRLHDSGKPGWIAFIAVALYLASLVLNIANIDSAIAMLEQIGYSSDPRAMMQGQAEFYKYALLGWAGYLIVIGFGVLGSEPGANQYGDEPS